MSIELKNVTYTYGPGTAYEIHALKDINLTIPDGQFIGVIGHTGSGKSTLIQHFNALVKPTSGTILYNGEDIWADKYNRKALRSDFFGCSSVVCLFFALYLVCSYQLWSSNPQLQDYVLPMLAGVMATLYAYQNAALAVGIGSRRMWLATGMLAICFGIGAAQGLLYPAIALWALTGLLPRCKKEET